MNVSELVARLAARTHPERAAAWDAVGLQVGDPEAPVRTVTVVHEVTEAVTRRLEAEPVDVVVAYHPLLFRAGGAARCRSQSVGPRCPPASRRSRRHRDAQRLRRHARGDVRRDGRRPRSRRRARVRPGRRRRAGQGRHVRSRGIGGDAHRGAVRRRRRPHRRLRTVRLHRRRCRPVPRRDVHEPGGGSRRANQRRAGGAHRDGCPRRPHRRRDRGADRSPSLRGAGVRRLPGGVEPRPRRAHRHVRRLVGRA